MHYRKEYDLNKKVNKFKKYIEERELKLKREYDITKSRLIMLCK